MPDIDFVYNVWYYKTVKEMIALVKMERNKNKD
jgi:hypothetical protein